MTMAAYVCAHCQLALPAQEQGRCPICDAALTYNMGVVPAPDWRERVRNLQGPDRDRAVTDWRLLAFLKLGVPQPDAEHLAARRDVDLHFVRRLLEHGCPVDTAVRIVA